MRAHFSGVLFAASFLLFASALVGCESHTPTSDQSDTAQLTGSQTIRITSDQTFEYSRPTDPLAHDGRSDDLR